MSRSPHDGGRHDCVATPSQTVGPFFHFGLPPVRAGAAPADGAPLHLTIRVLDGAGAPVPDALVEIYQADAAGAYRSRTFSGFGRLATGADGMCAFETVRPGRVVDAHGHAQAPHVDVCVFARGLLRHLYTRVYLAGDRDLDADPFLALVPSARRATLLATPAAGAADRWEWTIRLQGDDETVFFDL